jgi:hypothetical protein
MNRIRRHHLGSVAVVSQLDGTVSQAWDGHVPNHVRTSVRARTERIECR